MSVQVALWEAFRKGDEEAFSSIFILNLDTLYKYGVKFIGDEDFIKDCIQDLYVNLYNNKNLAKVSNPKLYLFRSLKNLIINRIAKESRMLPISLQDLPFNVVRNTEGYDRKRR